MRSTIIPFAVATAALIGCGSSSSTSCGAPGNTQACVCADGASGAQTCGATGAWEACGCGAATDTVGGDTSAPGDTSANNDTTAAADTSTPVLGCADPDASNFDGSATTDDGSCTYDVTFTVVVSVNPEDVVYVSGDFQDELGDEEWCAGCTPMPETSPGEHSVTVSLPPGTYQYKVQINEWESSETVPEECGVVNGDFVNRELVVVDAPVALIPFKYGRCPCDPATCNGANACVDLECGNRLQGIYTPGEYVIETERGTCRNKLGVIIGAEGSLRLFGVDPTTGEPDFAFLKVSCQSGFEGSSLPMRVEVLPNGAETEVTPPSTFSRPFKLVFKHADFTDEVTGTLTATITDGKFVGELSGLPQTVSIGLDNQVTSATFASPSP